MTDQAPQAATPLEDNGQLLPALPQTERSLLERLRAIPATSIFAGDEVARIVQEALAGNSAAQYILGAWFESDGQEEAARHWYGASAGNHYSPAQRRLVRLAPQQVKTA